MYRYGAKTETKEMSMKVLSQFQNDLFISVVIKGKNTVLPLSKPDLKYLKGVYLVDIYPNYAVITAD
jgi:hypothetical protein